MRGPLAIMSYMGLYQHTQALVGKLHCGGFVYTGHAIGGCVLTRHRKKQTLSLPLFGCNPVMVDFKQS